MDYAVAIAHGWDDLDHGFHETPRGVRYTITKLAPGRRCKSACWN